MNDVISLAWLFFLTTVTVWSLVESSRAVTVHFVGEEKLPVNGKVSAEWGIPGDPGVKAPVWVTLAVRCCRSVPDGQISSGRCCLNGDKFPTCGVPADFHRLVTTHAVHTSGDNRAALVLPQPERDRYRYTGRRGGLWEGGRGVYGLHRRFVEYAVAAAFQHRYGADTAVLVDGK